MENLQRTALITGAGQGIGRAIALALAHDGIIIAVNDLSMERAEAVCQEIREQGGTAIALAADVSNSDSVNQMFQQFFLMLDIHHTYEN